MRKFRVMMILLALLPIFREGSELASQELSGTISGLVTDEYNEPVIGASVQAMGTTRGTITNLEGQFSFEVTVGDTIQISYIGYHRELVVIADLSELNIQIRPDVEELEEVVVTAFALRREKKTLGYAVQEVKGNELTQATETNVAYALQGRISGVQFNRTGSGAGSAPGRWCRRLMRLVYLPSAVHDLLWLRSYYERVFSEGAAAARDAIWRAESLVLDNPHIGRTCGGCGSPEPRSP